MSYSIKNLRHLIENAILAEHFGIDLWNYESDKGGSIRLAIEYLIPFYSGGEEFTYQQIGGVESLADDLYELLLMVADKYDSEILREALDAIPASPPDHDIFHLLTPVF